MATPSSSALQSMTSTTTSTTFTTTTMTLTTPTTATTSMTQQMSQMSIAPSPRAARRFLLMEGIKRYAALWSIPIQVTQEFGNTLRTVCNVMITVKFPLGIVMCITSDYEDIECEAMSDDKMSIRKYFHVFMVKNSNGSWSTIITRVPLSHDGQDQSTADDQIIKEIQRVYEIIRVFEVRDDAPTQEELWSALGLTNNKC